LLLFKRHKNPDGTQGAFVEKTPGNSAVVKETVHAGENVIITGTAYIADKAVIEDDVTISGNVGIFNNVRLRGRIDVINNVHIAGMTSLVGINGNILMAKDYGLLKEGTVLGRHLRIVDNVIVAGNYPIRNEETD
jgi:UDP-3-O-[3-hydroxymyristoyl] glucosamine N-acyltransferase